MSDFILLVEDDEDIRTDLKEMLEISGYRTETAANGIEALGRLTEGSPRPAIILIDLMMPAMNGWQFRSALLERSGFASIPIVVMSGAANMHEDAREIGAVAYFSKPFSMRSLLDTIGRYWPRQP